jgi:hypothetical protein
VVFHQQDLKVIQDKKTLEIPEHLIEVKALGKRYFHITQIISKSMALDKESLNTRIVLRLPRKHRS